MGTNCRKSVSGLILASDCKRNDRRLVPRKEVLPVTLQQPLVPIILLLDFLKSGLAESKHGLLGRMEGRGCCVHELEEVLGFDWGGVDFGLKHE